MISSQASRSADCGSVSPGSCAPQGTGTTGAISPASAVTLNYGMFINVCISFVIVAWAVFLMIKLMNRLKREEPAAPAAPAEPPAISPPTAACGPA